MAVAKKLVPAKVDSFVDDVREQSLAVTKSGGPVADAKLGSIAKFKTGVISSFAPVVVAEIKKIQVEEVTQMPYKSDVKKFPEPFTPKEPEFTPVIDAPKIDIGIVKVPETGGIAGTVLGKKTDMSFLNKLVDKIVGKDKLTGDPKKDFEQISKTAGKIINTSKSVTGAIQGGLQALGTFVPGGALAASAFSKLTGSGAGGALAAAADGKDKTKFEMPWWGWALVGVGVLFMLPALLGKKLFK